MSQQANYMQVAAWVHCLRCHKTYHRDDTMLHFYTTCPNKDDRALPANLQMACLCLMPDFDFVPDREGLTW